jgi:hypothetical protein
MITLSRRIFAGSLALIAASLAASLPALAGAFPFRIAYRIPVSGATSVAALAFGPGGTRAFAVDGNELRAFDAATGAPGSVVTLPGAAVDVAAAADRGGELYVAVRSPARIVVLSLQALRTLSSVALRAGEPSGLLYQAGEHALYVESATGHSVARLDPVSGRTLAVVHLQGVPAQMAGDGRGTLYIANSGSNAIDVVDTSKMTFKGAIPTPNCDAPTGLAMDPVGRRLFVACSNGAALVIDTDIGFAFEQLPIHQDTGLRTIFAFHPNGPGGWKGGVFTAGEAPVLEAIRMNAFISYTGGGSLSLPGRATALALNPAAGRLWVAVAPRNRADAGSAQPATGVEILALGPPSEGVSP